MVGDYDSGGVCFVCDVFLFYESGIVVFVGINGGGVLEYDV